MSPFLSFLLSIVSEWRIWCEELRLQKRNKVGGVAVSFQGIISWLSGYLAGWLFGWLFASCLRDEIRIVKHSHHLPMAQKIPNHNFTDII